MPYSLTSRRGTKGAQPTLGTRLEPIAEGHSRERYQDMIDDVMNDSNSSPEEKINSLELIRRKVSKLEDFEGGKTQKQNQKMKRKRKTKRRSIRRRRLSGLNTPR